MPTPGSCPGFVVPDCSFPAYVLADAETRGDHQALIEARTGRTITYAQLARLVRQVAAGLAARGWVRGDVLAIYAPNCPEYAVAAIGALSLGVIVTTVNPLYTADELAAQLKDSRARALLTIAPLLPNATTAAERAGVHELYVFDDPPAGSPAHPLSDLLAHGDDPPPVSIDPARDLAFLPYSSGTTGLPKGVMLTHRNVVANVEQLFLQEPDLVSPEDHLIAVLPFFHIYGLVPVMSGVLHAGATLVVMPRFDLEAFLETLQRYRVTGIHVVPPIVLALAKHPAVDRYDLSALRWVNSGAAPLDAALAGACAARLRCIVRQGYGLTETSPATHFLRNDEAETRAGTVGRAVPGTEVRIVDVATGETLPPGVEGEVWVRGPQVMLGYLGNPEATAEMLTPDGWLRTGDVGSEDADGYLRVVDRVKELIKFKGMQVAPAELEALLLSHPSVSDAAVIPQGCDNATYEAVMSAALGAQRGAGVEAVAFGDLFLADVRAYRERLVAPTGLRPLFPLWGADTAALARRFVALGLRAVLVCVDPAQLDPAFCGREYDDALLDALPPSVDPCGENGEFHTFVYDGPGFTEPVACARGESVDRGGFRFCDLLPD